MKNQLIHIDSRILSIERDLTSAQSSIKFYIPLMWKAERRLNTSHELNIQEKKTAYLEDEI